MSVQIASMFAVPVGQGRMPDAGPLNRELEALLLAREADPERHRNSHPSLKQQEGVFESNFDLFASPEPCIRRLRAFCWSMLGEAIQQTNGYSPDELRRLEIFSHTWFHVTRQGGFTILHTHPMASWSGVYCVSPGDAVPGKPESGVLRFHNPHGYSNTFMDPGNAHFRPPYHHGSWSFVLEAGQLVLFPSWLQHEVLPYYGQSPRITVAFNCWFGTKPAG